jgi:hypothetical protein
MFAISVHPGFNGGGGRDVEDGLVVGAVGAIDAVVLV